MTCRQEIRQPHMFRSERDISDIHLTDVNLNVLIWVEPHNNCPQFVEVPYCLL